MEGFNVFMNLERQTELENNDLDEDLVDPLFATDNWF